MAARPFTQSEIVSCSVASFCGIARLQFTCARKAGDKAILKMRGLLRNYSVIPWRSNEVRNKEVRKQGNLYIAVADALTVSPGVRRTDGTAGQIERRVA